MSNAEHYFENLLYRYARSENEKASLSEIIDEPDSNKANLTNEELRTIETCFIYLAFYHTPKQMQKFLDGDDDE